MIKFLGLEWHLYGVLLGVSVWLGWELVVYQARLRKVSITRLQQVLPWVILGGVVGARLYHVITDWQLYMARPLEALYIWQGGLSVIGAVLGGATVLSLWLWRSQQLKKVPLYLDLSVFGLPVAQAVGRIGNYVNHELYGRPTTLPWAIPIEPQFRLANYQEFATYHPLFAYEMVALLVFAGVAWWLVERQKQRLGTGLWFASYVAYYAVVRFLLDFLRIDTAYVNGTPFTINQVVMIVVLVASLLFIGKKVTYART